MEQESRMRGRGRTVNDSNLFHFFSRRETIQLGTAIRANSTEGNGKRICHSRNHPIYSSPALRAWEHTGSQD